MKIVDAIISEKAREHNTTVADILGPSRFVEHVAARHDAIRTIVERHPRLSIPRIAEALSMDHTTIYFALGRLSRKPTARTFARNQHGEAHVTSNAKQNNATDLGKGGAGRVPVPAGEMADA